jgi:hypothetical protein
MNYFICTNIYATVTQCDTVLCDIFDGHLKDGRRHGMDTYLLPSALLWNHFLTHSYTSSDFIKISY